MSNIAQHQWRRTVSDISVPLAYQTFEQPSSAKSAGATSNPLGLWTVLGCSAAGCAISVMGALLNMTGKLPSTLAPFIYIPVVLAAAAPLWLARQSLREYLALTSLRGRDIGRGIGYGAIGYVVLAMVFAVIALAQYALGDTGSTTAPVINKVPFNAQMMIDLLSLWALMVIGAPIGEELLFRGLLYRGLESRLGALATIML